MGPPAGVFRTYYEPDGKPLRETKPNNTLTEYTYDGRDRLVKLRHQKPGGGALDEFLYGYDLVGRVIGEEDLQGRVHGLEYDRAGRLVRETHPDLGAQGNVYEYDKNDNRTRVIRNGVSDYLVYNDADQLLWVNRNTTNQPNPGQAAPYTLLQYDEEGQLVFRDRKTGAGRNQLSFRWDSAGRLREVMRSNGVQVLAATYAPDGERVTKQDTQAQHTYSYGLHDTAGNTYYTPGLAESQNGAQRYYHHNRHGSTRYLTAPNGTQAAGIRYDAYGRKEGGSTGDPTDYQYGGAWGYEREPDTTADLKLDYLYQRYYDRETGRFISRDPIGYAGGLNLYAYCAGDPVNYVDPLGLAPKTPRPPGYNPKTWIVLESGDFQAPQGSSPYTETWHWHPRDNIHPQEHWDVARHYPPVRAGRDTGEYTVRHRYYPRTGEWELKADSRSGVTHRLRQQRAQLPARQAARLSRTLGRNGLRCLGPVFSLYEAVVGRWRERREYEEYWSTPGNHSTYLRNPAEWHRRNPLSLGPPL